MTISVLLADDQMLVRAGFHKLLENEPGIVIVGEAGNGLEAFELARRHQPDVVLMDIRMPELDGLEATRRVIREVKGTKVLILTTFDLDEYVFEAIRAGASGFVLKDSPLDQLVSGIHVVAGGEALLAPSITRRLIEEFARRPSSTASPIDLTALTARELEVLKLVATGLSNSEVADKLVVSGATVKTHVGNIFMKLDLRDRAQAVVLAYESGLVQAGHTSS